MPILLFRVDERLIHGQVVLGWGGRLGATRYLVIDDAIAGRTWEQELYRLALPPGSEALFLGVSEARDRLPEFRGSEIRTILLTRDPATMTAIARNGTLAGEEVNLGGLHHSEGRCRVLPWLFLSEADRSEIARLLEEGVQVVARDVPGSSPVSAEDLLR